MGINIQHVVRQVMRREILGGRGCGGAGERKRDTHTTRFKVRDSATETETGRDRNREANHRQKNRQTERHAHTQTDRQTDTGLFRDTDAKRERS